MKLLGRLVGILSIVGCAVAAEITSDGTFEITRLNGGEPIVTEEMFQKLGAGDREGKNINGPSVIQIPDWIPPVRRADPSARYYLYFAHHRGKYIRMAWAADIEGPWHLHDVGQGVAIGDKGVLDLGGKRMVIGKGLSLANNHIASPNVHVDEQNRRIVLYFHSGKGTEVKGEPISGPRTLVATSPYGLEFKGRIEPVMLGESYFVVFEHANEVYAMANRGRFFQARSADSPWTPPTGWDLVQDLWIPATKNRFQNDIEAAGYDIVTGKVRHSSILVRGDTLYVFYSQSGLTPPERLMMSTIDLSVDGGYDEWDPSYPPEEIYRAQPGWEGGDLEVLPSRRGKAPEDVNQLRDPFVFEDSDGEIYLFYAGRGEDAIGLLHLEPLVDLDMSSREQDMSEGDMLATGH